MNGRPHSFTVREGSNYNTYYYEYNWRGDVAFLRRPDGSSIMYPFLTGTGDYSMSLFGQNDNAGPHNRYRWNGAWGYLWIPEAGLYLIGQRWYHPDIGRFLAPNSPDYIYAKNDPVNYAYAPVYNFVAGGASANLQSGLGAGTGPWLDLESVIGIRVHQDLLKDFQNRYGGFTGLRSIDHILSHTITWNLGDLMEDVGGRYEPDLVNTISKEVYEIKPAGNRAGPSQLDRYLGELNARDPSAAGSPWLPGISHFPLPRYEVQLGGTPSVLRYFPAFHAEVYIVISTHTQYNALGQEGMIYYVRESVRYRGELHETLAAAAALGGAYAVWRLVRAVGGCALSPLAGPGAPAVCAIAVAAP